MEEEKLSALKSLLGKAFRYNKYPDAIQVLRESINSDQFKNYWSSIKEAITSRSFDPGIALGLIIISANLPLDEYSDREAYKWFDLMVKNVEDANGEVEEY